jgi:lipoprotein-releasing system permease protein
MRYEIFIGLRYLKSRIGLLFSVGGVAVGITAVVVVLSVMNGWESIIRDKMLSSEGHIFVSGRGGRPFVAYRSVMQKIEDIEGVVATAPVLVRQAAIMDEDGKNQTGAMVKAIVPELETKVTGIENYVSGELSFESPESPLLQQAKDGTEDSIFGGIILGRGLADKIRVSEGDVVRIISRLVETPGGLQPVIRTFVVVDIYDSGMYSYDSVLAFISLQVGQELFSLGDNAFDSDAVDRIEVKIENIYKARDIREKIQNEFGFSLFTMTWMEAHASLFDAIKMEKVVTFVIEALIIFVAAFNIASTLIMIVMDKVREIGILKSMGATNGNIWLIFAFEGTLIGVVGAVLGTLLGVVLCWSLRTWLPIPIPGNIYQIDRLPAEISWSFVAFVNVASVILCWLATLYPAWRASRLRPVEALRYE